MELEEPTLSLSPINDTKSDEINNGATDKESTSVENKDSVEVEQVIKVVASKPQMEDASEDLPLQESDKENSTSETKPRPSIHEEQTNEKIPTSQEFTRETLDHDVPIGPTQIENTESEEMSFKPEQEHHCYQENKEHEEMPSEPDQEHSSNQENKEHEEMPSEPDQEHTSNQENKEREEMPSEPDQEHPSNQEIPLNNDRLRTILGRMLGRIIGKKAASYVEGVIRYIGEPGRWFLTLIKKK